MPPRLFPLVDQSKCTVCTLCREVCDCLAIQPVSGPVEGLGHNVPRMVDPMLCTGEGTCAASCPEMALTLANCTMAQHEARVTALARSLAPDEVMGFGCQWSGAAAADQAGFRGLSYNRRFFLLPVRCLGTDRPGGHGPGFPGRGQRPVAHRLQPRGVPPQLWHGPHLEPGLGPEKAPVPLRPGTGAHRPGPQRHYPAGPVRDHGGELHEDHGDPGPHCQRDAETQSRLQALYDTLHVYRVRWVLGVSLRRPWETAYPSHMPNPAAYDHTLTEILTEEFFRARVKNLMRSQGKLLQLNDITQALGVDEAQAHEYLKDMGYEGLIAISFVNRTRFYGLPSGPQ